MPKVVGPVTLPAEQMRAVRSFAAENGLTAEEVIRRSAKLGLELLRDQVAGRVTNVPPISAREWRRIYARARVDDDANPELLAAQSNPLEAE